MTKFNGIPPYRETRNYVSRILVARRPEVAPRAPARIALIAAFAQPFSAVRLSKLRRTRPSVGRGRVYNPRSGSADNVHTDKILRGTDGAGSLSTWSFAAGSAPRAGRSSKASTSPTARRGSGASSRKRACSSSAMQRAGPARAGVRSSCRGARRDLHARVPRLQPGAGDAAQGRHAARPVARHPAAARRQSAASRRCSTTSTSGCGRAARCRRRSTRTGTLFPGRLHRVAARGREERQPRAGDPPLRRVREGRLGRASARPISALVYPAILLVLSLSSSSASSCCGSCRRSARSTTSSASELPLSTRIIVAFSEFAGTYFFADAVRASWAPCSPSWPWLQAGRGNRRRFDQWMLQLPMLGADRAEVRDLAGGAHAGDAARRRHPAGQRDRRVGALDRQPVHGARAHAPRRSRCARAGRLPRRCCTSGAFPDVAIKMAEVGESTGALQEMLNSLADFYDEEIETNLDAVRHARRAGAAGRSWASSSPACCCRSTCRCSIVVDDYVTVAASYQLSASSHRCETELAAASWSWS